MTLNKTFVSTAVALSLLGACNAFAEDADIYAIQFTEDGKHLITGGSGGLLAGPGDDFTGGIKVWDADRGELVQAMGQQADLDAVFGMDHSRVGQRQPGISNFRDMVMYGSYPNGKVLVLPSSLGHITDAQSVRAPSFIGGAMDFSDPKPQRVNLAMVEGKKGNCDDNPYMYDYVGPVVPSDNGHYAAVVVNICHKQAVTETNTRYAYRSTLHVMNLGTQEIIKTHDNIDAGIYALGISNGGDRVAFVGRDQFAVLDVASGDKQLVEEYSDADFMIPRQFSKLNFSEDGSKLVSLDFIYDIKSGTEQPMTWVANNAEPPERISNVAIAPDLSYFVMVQRKQSLFMIGEDGLPVSYGQADDVMIMDTKSGEQVKLEITDSLTEGKQCVTDVSPDSERVAVACNGGIMRMFNARNGELLWSKRNVSYKAKELSKGLIQAWNRHSDTPMLFTSLN
jgi:WD40 repeat protein